jgi:hypothetical protein
MSRVQNLTCQFKFFQSCVIIVLKICHNSSHQFGSKIRKQLINMKLFSMTLNASKFSISIQILKFLTLPFLPCSYLADLEINGRQLHLSSSPFLTLQQNQVKEKIGWKNHIHPCQHHLEEWKALF